MRNCKYEYNGKKYLESKLKDSYNKSLQEGLGWLGDVLPNTQLELVDGMVDNIGKGSYNTVTDLIRLSKDYADKGTVKHEAVHKVLNMLPNTEREKILNAGSKKYGIKRGESKTKIKYSKSQQNQINYTLKAVDILQSKKGEQVFNKGKKNGWDLNKILTELQVPKEQKKIVLDKYKSKVSEQEFVKSIFPDTKVKKIAYHGRTKQDELVGNGFHFGTQEAATQRVNARIEQDLFTDPTFDFENKKELKRIQDANRVYDNVIINIKTPLQTKDWGYSEAWDRIVNNTRKNKEYDSLEYINEVEDKGSKSYVVFEPEQIHILTEEEQAKIYNEGNLREEIITSLLAENSFAVEINTSKSPIITNIDDGAGGLVTRRNLDGNPTSYYSNLSAPGNAKRKNKYAENPDWEYQELEIATPLIIPSIKGHAQFSTDNGIGWIRVWYNKKTGAVEIQEIQSDLFQKGRDKNDLISEPDIKMNDEGEEYSEIQNLKNLVARYKEGIVQEEITEEDAKIEIDKLNKKINKKLNERNNNRESVSNKFLQLLNKKNNWVTVFVKSIIQDSVKKGYEKVLFPKGDTAAKIEGHQTLEEFKKQKEEWLWQIRKDKKELINKKNFYTQEGDSISVNNDGKYIIMDGETGEYSYLKVVEYTNYKTKAIEQKNREIKTLKQELKNVESGQTQLSSIAKFYEDTITNILIKQFGVDAVKLITDEYGNKWNELDLSNAKVKEQTENILFQSIKLEYTGDLAIEEKIAEEAETSKDRPKGIIEEFIQRIKDFLNDLFKSSDKILQLITDLNKGKFKNKSFNFNPSEEQITNSNNCK